MSPLMQALCKYVDESCLDRYIDVFQRNAYSNELDRLHKALSAALPESCLNLLETYEITLGLRSNLETEAMFLAAFDAARELR